MLLGSYERRLLPGKDGLLIIINAVKFLSQSYLSLLLQIVMHCWNDYYEYE